MKTVRTTTRCINLPENDDPQDTPMTRYYCDQCGHHHGEADNQWPPCGAYRYTDPGGTKRCGCTHEQPPDHQAAA